MSRVSSLPAGEVSHVIVLQMVESEGDCTVSGVKDPSEPVVSYFYLSEEVNSAFFTQISALLIE